jgi:hypothetical protein
LAPVSRATNLRPMLEENVGRPDTMSTRAQLRLLVEFFVWLLSAPLSDRRA